jgi:hypothetical protein
MKLSQRQYVGLAETMLQGAGLTTSFRQGRHLRLTARNAQGHSGHLTFSMSPRSDLKCQINMARQEAKRLIRELVPASIMPPSNEQTA